MINTRYLIIGLGQTGLSVARFLAAQQQPFAAYEADSRSSNLAIFKSQYPDTAVHMGEVPKAAIDQVDIIVVSPGVPLDNPEITYAKQHNKLIIGDIELFSRYNKKPIIAVTGSNGKSTVVSLLGEMAKCNGVKAAVMGNIGKPVLDMLLDEDYAVAVMELSSFQLETTLSLRPTVATVLNISEDHLDRHKTLENYTRLKHRIYENAKFTVSNANDPATTPKQNSPTCVFSSAEAKFDTDSFQIKTDQYLANVMAALAIADCMRWNKDKCLKAAAQFTGLPHRLKHVVTKNKIAYYNDSKATNVGAALAAIESVAKLIEGKQVLIMGGAAKGGSFAPLTHPIEQYAKAVILLGRDAKLIEQCLPESVQRVYVSDIPDAVRAATRLAHAGDAVLLVPACTSWDMFKNYQERGEQFEQELN